MGLPIALKAHGEGNLGLAATHYQRALEQNHQNPVLFQNYGALLRGNGDVDRARRVYCLGLDLFPRHLGILRNYANLLREQGEVTAALQITLQALRIAWQDQDGNALEIIYCESIDLLHEQGSLQWALSLLRQALGRLVLPKLLWSLFRLSCDDRSSSFDSSQTNVIFSSIEEKLPELKILDHAQFLFYKSVYLATPASFCCELALLKKLTGC